MNQRHYLLKGTVLLTLTGLLTKIAGFFYKIFLSRAISAKEIGLFQLTMPIYMFCTAASCGGIQTAISRYTAEYYAEGDKKSALRILACGLFLSLGLSLCCAAALYCYAPWLAGTFLLEPGCTKLLRVMAVSLPFVVIHACISGFFIGQKNVAVPAAAQLLEQMLRIASVFFFYILFQKNGHTMNAVIMALGQIAGELSSAVFCTCYLFFSKQGPLLDLHFAYKIPENSSGNHARIYKKLLPAAALKKTISISLPLGLNRMLLCILQGIEAALLPQQLQRFGFNSHDALSVYGTLTGMAMPLILFPTAITGALSTLLLPAVSEAKALRQEKKITTTVNASFSGGLLLGLFFLAAFLQFGPPTGQLLFHNQMAGSFIQKLALICPFLYINTTMISILHGLGKTTAVFIWNICCFLIRLASVLVLVPDIGIDGYLSGMIFSQLFQSVCSLILLYRSRKLTVSAADTLTKPGITCILSIVICRSLQAVCPLFSVQSWSGFLLCVLTFSIIFLLLAAFILLSQNDRKTLVRFVKIKTIAFMRSSVYNGRE